MPPKNPVTMRFLSSDVPGAGTFCVLSKRGLGGPGQRLRGSEARDGVDAAEAPLASREFGDGRSQVAGSEVRPADLGEVELSVSSLPEQEIAHPMLAARADHE